MKTAELNDALLDEYVARALGLRVEKRFRREVNGEIMVLVEASGATRGVPHYSKDWREAGPIIERERIDSYWFVDEWVAGYDIQAATDSWGQAIGFFELDHEQRGQTLLIAAMRSFVARCFGDEVLDEVAATQPKEPT